MAGAKTEIRQEASRLEKVWAAKARHHNADAEIWGWIFYLLSIPAAVLAAIASASRKA